MDWSAIYQIGSDYALPILGILAAYFGWSATQKEKVKKEMGEAVSAIRDAVNTTNKENLKNALDEVVDVGFVASKLWQAKDSKSKVKDKVKGKN